MIDGFQMYGVKPTELGQTTAKQIYNEYIQHTIPEPKVTDYLLQVNFPGGTCGPD